MTAINPSLVLGDTVINRSTSSVSVIKWLMKVPFLITGYFSTVSVYDVALAHVRALERPTITKDKRYIISENTYTVKELVGMLRQEFNPYGYRFGYIPVPFSIQTFGTKLLNLFGLRGDRLFHYYNYDNSPSVRELGLSYRPIS